MGKLNTYISSNQGWSLKEQLFLKENYFKLPMKELILKLNRSEGAIAAKASDMGLNLNSMKKSKPVGYSFKSIPVAPTPKVKTSLVDSPNLVKKGRGKPWSNEHDQYLIDNYPTSSIADIALHVNRTKKAVVNRAEELRNKGFVIPKKKPVKKYTDFMQISKVTIPYKEKVANKSYYLQTVADDTNNHKLEETPVFATEQILSVSIDSLTVKTLTSLTNYMDSLNIKYNIKTQKV